MLPYIDERQFTEFVAAQIRHGFNLVPFVGSGISAPSGIVMGQDFMNYLTWVVYRSVAKRMKDNEELTQKEPRLDLRKEGWPEPPNATQVKAARKWTGEVFKNICKQHDVDVELESGGLVKTLRPSSGSDRIESRLRRPFVPGILRTPKTDEEDNELRMRLRSRSGEWNELSRIYSAAPDVSLTTESYIFECAIRALQDWRCALDFLARLHVGETHGLPLWLDTADQTIIDSFIFFITHGRKPNLAHNMLCHLASRARIRTILTTNFDTLLEDAFSELGDHFEVIPVGIRGELPPAGTVRAQNSIVKLHGALVDTRADLSLDERPTEQDLQRFFEYVRGRPVRPRSPGFLPGLLLVCGCSATDLRCVQMIKYLLDADTSAQVLWVCHTDVGLEQLGRIFRDGDYRIAHGPEDITSARIVATVTGRTDLLLYELYQRLTLSLPRGGFNYQFSPNLPPQQHRRIGEETSSQPSSGQQSYSDQLENLLTVETGRVIIADGRFSLMDPMRTIFEKMTHKARQNRKNGIWLELEDYPDTASVAHEIFTIIALRLGRFQLDHARLVPPTRTSEPDWPAHLAQILIHWAIDPSEWFIVFYGRNGPGKCAGWERTVWGGDLCEGEYEKFEKFLKALSTARAPGHAATNTPVETGQGFLLLYAPYSTDRYDEACERQKIIADLTNTWRKERRRLNLARENEWSESEVWEQYVQGDGHSNIFSRAARYRVCDKNRSLIPVHDCKGDLFTGGVAETHELSPVKFMRSLEIIWNEWLMEPKKKEQPDDKRRRLNARRALYSATLFRQARHFSAFLSEGVYPCPCRYNTNAVDNDWLRNDHVKVWLEQWSNLSKGDEKTSEGVRDFFSNKPGGFAWTDHDSRLGVQRLIEGMGPLEFVLRGNCKSYAAQVRARMHYWIGEWYCRAYRATGHADPLLEAIYHFRECIHYCPFAMPLGRNLSERDVPFYRFRIARRALLQLIKALRLGRAELRLWIQGAAGDPWFGEHATEAVITGFERVFETLQRNLPSGPERYTEWLSDLRWEMFTLPHLREDDMRELRFTEKVGDITSPPVSRHPSPFLSAVTAHSPKKDIDWLATLAKQWSLNLAAVEHVDAIEPSFSTLIGALKTDGKGEGLAVALNERLKDWRDKTVANYDPERLFILAQVTRELAYQVILRAKRRHHNLGSDNQLLLEPKLAMLWVQACGLCWLTLDLCDELPSALLASESGLRIVACSLYGLALGRLGRFYEAHRRLNEAHAWLSKSGGMSDPPDAAVIKLRRAEVHIFEALRIRCILTRLDARLSSEMEEWRQSFSEVRIDGVDEEDDILAQWQKMYFTVPHKTPISVDKALKRFCAIHVAKLDDAWLALESAERVLSGKSHSSLWWGHLHQLRLRVYATHWIPKKCKVELPIALAFRKRRDYGAAVRKTYHAGLVASRADSYHAIRLADYGLQAVTQLDELGKAGSGNTEEFANELLSHFPEETETEDSLLVEYRRDVYERIEKAAKITKRPTPGPV
jgi:hypothetical protein